MSAFKELTQFGLPITGGFLEHALHWMEAGLHFDAPQVAAEMRAARGGTWRSNGARV